MDLRAVRRTYAGAVSVIAVIASGLSASAQDAVKMQVNIPSQSLQSALAAIGDDYGVTIVAPGALVRGKTAPPVTGEMTIDQAVARLLDGSGLEARRSSSGAIMVAMAVAEPAGYAEEALRIEEAIIVTARKRDEDLQDVPISVTVFDDEEIQNSNFETFADYALRTPNISFQNNGGAARTVFAIRGVGGGNVASGTGTAAGFYLDEIILNPTGGLRQNDLALLDLERIEVLRGPQGTLFGRNTIGGAVNLITRKPNETLSGRVTAGLERFGSYSVQGHVNVPIADGIYLQGSGLHRNTDGFIENTTNGETLSSGASGGRLALRLVPVDALTIDLAAMRNEVRYDALQGITEENFDAELFETPLPFQDENDVLSDLFTARIQYSAPGFDVISLTAFNEFDASETFDITGLLGPAPAFGDITTSQENISQELRVQSRRQDARINWLVGANYSKTDDRLERIGAFGTPDNPGMTVQTQVETGDVQNIAVFANVDIALNDLFTLTLGGRYSWDEYDLVAVNDTVFSGSNEAFTPSFTLQYQPSDDLMVYGTISRGYRPGGVDTDFFDPDPSDDTTSEYDPETAWNYEIGANATWLDGMMVGRASAFYLDFNDIQAVFFTPGGLFETITTNGAAARIYGAEFDVSVFPTAALSFNFNLGLLDTEFTDFADSPQGDLTGNSLPYAPAVNLSAVGEYRHPISGALDGFFRAEYSYRSDQEGRNNNNPVELQPAYDLLNLRFGVATSNFEFEIYGENVLDEVYFTNRRPGPTITVTPGRPAIWGVRATARL